MVHHGQVNFLAIGLGFAIWALLLMYIWLPTRRKNRRREDPASFADWRQRHQLPQASFEDFILSDEGPRKPLSRAEETIVVTMLALLALYMALAKWGVI